MGTQSWVELGREDGPNGEETIYKIDYDYSPPDPETGSFHGRVHLYPQDESIVLTDKERSYLEQLALDEIRDHEDGPDYD